MASDDANEVEYLSIEEFLRQRYDALEPTADLWALMPDVARVIHDDLVSKRRIIEWHGNWPVMITTPDNVIELEPNPTNMDQIRLRMISKLDFLTQQQYVKRFGDAPPSAPILRHMAYPFRNHKDYNPAWSM